MPQVKRHYNYHKLYRQTNGFIKKPSARYVREQARAKADQIRNEVANYDDAYTVIESDGTVHNYIDKASDNKFGIFHIKGYRAIRLFATREEAEKELATWRNPNLYQVREIEWFEEDKEK
jgi:hypothetical protein